MIQKVQLNSSLLYICERLIQFRVMVTALSILTFLYDVDGWGNCHRSQSQS